jgi:rhodanese-related sulfurtransferase
LTNNYNYNNISMGKQILFILGICIVVGLAINFVRPGGLPLVIDESMYSEENSDKLKQQYEQGQIKTQNIMQNPNYDPKTGMVKPQNIKMDFAKLLHEKGALFIDGRPKHEYDAGKIKGAISIPYEDFMKISTEDKRHFLSNIGKDDIIVVYCSGGECEISIDLAYEIARLGYTSLNIYRGGYKEWETAGYPIEK